MWNGRDVKIVSASCMSTVKSYGYAHGLALAVRVIDTRRRSRCRCRRRRTQFSGRRAAVVLVFCSSSSCHRLVLNFLNVHVLVVVLLPLLSPPGAGDVLRHVRPGDPAVREETRPFRRQQPHGLRAGGGADSARPLPGWSTYFCVHTLHVLIDCTLHVVRGYLVFRSSVCLGSAVVVSCVVFSAVVQAPFSRRASRFGFGRKYMARSLDEHHRNK